jgi:hypothetical protein
MMPLYCGVGEVLDSHPRLNNGFVETGVALFPDRNQGIDIYDATPFDDAVGVKAALIDIS